MTKLAPLVKWIGGKRRLAPKILESFPSTFRSYSEPFVGGGAVFAALWNAGRLTGVPAAFNDLNGDVIDLYQMVRDDPDKLVTELKQQRDTYYAMTTEERSKLYYQHRALWNEGDHAPARFVFLKQTSFNGLWRVNDKGELNAAWGKYEDPKILDEENIRAWNVALQKVGLTKLDFFDLTWSPQPGDLVYVDPPYVGTFDGYTSAGFDYPQHAALLTKLWNWTQLGASVVYSNSMEAAGLASIAWPSGIQKPLKTSYTVNRDGAGRSSVDELLIFQHAHVPESAKKRVRTGVRIG